jgi:MFS family permease
MVTPQNGGLIQDLFRGAERGRAFGLLGATIGLSTAAGPVIGGFILGVAGESDGWRWVFLVNLPFGLLTLVLALLLVPRTPKRTTRADTERAAGVWTDEHGDPCEERARDLRAQEGRRRTEAREAPSGARQSDIDLVGILLLGLTVLCVMFPVVLSDSDGVRRFWWLFVVAVPLGWVFHRWERRRVRDERAPLVDMRLFTSTAGYPSGAAVAAVYFCGFSGIWLVFAVYFQTDLGLSPLESGLAVTPFSLGSAVSSWVAGRLVARWGQWVTITGLVLMVIGLGAVGLLGFVVDKDSLMLAIAFPLLVAGVGGGAVISPNTTLTLACVPSSMSGVASGVLQTGQRLGSAVGTAVLAAVFHAVASASGVPATGFSFAMIAAVILILIALALALAERSGRIGNTVLENFSSSSMASGQ